MIVLTTIKGSYAWDLKEARYLLPNFLSQMHRMSNVPLVDTAAKEIVWIVFE